MTTRQNTDYGYDIQKVYLEMFMTDAQSFVRCQGVFDPQTFDRRLQDCAKFIKDYVEEHNALPTFDILNAATDSNLKDPGQLQENHYDWLLQDFETFSKHKALEAAILKSADLLENGQYGACEDLVKNAVQIGLTKDLGTDYWKDPRARLEGIKTNNGQVSTGWPALDKKLFGGFNRGELNIFAAASGGGKSLFLQNLALNWAQQGFNVIYVSLELSEELCSMRLDSMLTGYTTKDLFRNVEDVDLKIRMQGKKSGKIQIVQLPNGITVNDLNSYIKEFEVKNNMKIDGILLDYLDLMMPAQSKVSPSDLFIKDKFVSEELRNFAVEHDILFATASQLNRSAVEEIEFDHSHISGGLSKIQTADNVIGIFTSQAMRERGRYQVQFMKTRSSAGVGQKVDLAFDVSGLRITDLEDDDVKTEKQETNDLYNKIKRKTMADAETNPNVAAVDNIGSDRLKSILKKQD